ncbi:2-dehydropantoate 2-reductase [Zavarzinia sp. CC-PAN008]|uniref:2-dehydropantoate 2-reductase n=1 Tax=Zavarzinia sp. CC-PAN008 TaxID=3243332 RepID=UPI003F745476
MRILILGAGGTGGYFGARLLAAGRDVTFLVRPARAAVLRAQGLRVKSPHGDLHLPEPPLATTETLRGPYDLVVLSCKAYDLDASIEAIAPAVGPDTAILPLLNGMAHVEALARRFGEARVLGGLCVISATIGADGSIVQLTQPHSVTYGELDGSRSPRIAAIEAAFAGAGFDARASTTIRQDMWDKWVFISTLAGSTCLMRATIGDIVAGGGGDVIAGLHDECLGVAAANGFPVAPQVVQGARANLTMAGSPLTASMLRDLEGGGRVEAEHMIGGLVARAGDVPVPLLRLVLTNLRAYEARRTRTAG